MQLLVLVCASGSDWLQGCCVACDWEGRRDKLKGGRGPVFFWGSWLLFGFHLNLERSSLVYLIMFCGVCEFI